jgi:hypothetical protein
MHLEILVEDQSSSTLLNVVLQKLLANTNHTYKLHAYNGIGRLPPDLTTHRNPQHRILLEQLPKLLSGYGKTYPSETFDQHQTIVFVVCDLDNRCLSQFRQAILSLLTHCTPAPRFQLCIAVEEAEAWLLGDTAAVLKAYPKAKIAVLDRYIPDAICGTWEVLKEALASKNISKADWAKAITPHMDPDKNQSPSFQYFKTKLEALCLD